MAALVQIMAWCWTGNKPLAEAVLACFSDGCVTQPPWVNTSRPRQNGRRVADDSFKYISLNENVWIPIKISLKFVPKGPINNIPALVQIMAWCRPGNKPLSEPMMVSLPTHICVTRPQWVNTWKSCQILWDCVCHVTWWYHDMETPSALLTHCEGNPPVDPHKVPAVMETVEQTFEGPSTWGAMMLLWHHCNGTMLSVFQVIRSLVPGTHHIHDDVIKWKYFPCYWPFVPGIHWSRWIPRTKASDAELWCFLWSMAE